MATQVSEQVHHVYTSLNTRIALNKLMEPELDEQGNFVAKGHRHLPDVTALQRTLDREVMRQVTTLKDTSTSLYDLVVEITVQQQPGND